METNKENMINDASGTNEAITANAERLVSEERPVSEESAASVPSNEWGMPLQSAAKPDDSKNISDYSDLNGLMSEVSAKDSSIVNQEIYETTKIKSLKSNRKVVVLILSLLLISALAFGGYQTVSAIKYSNIAATNKSYYEQEQKRATDLDGQIVLLRDELGRTEADKKALEELNKSLESQNGALDKKATSAEEQMKSAQADLAAKRDELAKINNTLAAKKSELEKAQRGIAKFSEIEKLYISFKTEKDKFAGYNALIIDNINDYLYGGDTAYIDKANANLALAKASYDEMEKLNVKMNAIFDIIKSGNY